MHTTRRGALRALTALVLAGSLAACGTGTTTSTSEATSTTDGPALTVTDGWVKATTEEMTGAFGTLRNTGDEDVVITGGSSDVAGLVEAHVMTKNDSGSMVMTKAEDGHTVPAEGELVLEPGGAHLMLMQLTDEVVAGEDYVITVTTEGGESIDLSFAGREFSGAHEEYDPDASHDPHGHEESSATPSSSR